MSMETGYYWLRPREYPETPWQIVYAAGWPWGVRLRFIGAEGVVPFSHAELAQRFELVGPLNTP